MDRCLDDERQGERCDVEASAWVCPLSEGTGLVCVRQLSAVRGDQKTARQVMTTTTTAGNARSIGL